MQPLDIESLQSKLQLFYNQLEDDEKVVIARVLLQATGDAEDVTGHSACGSAPPAPPAFSVPAGAELSISTDPADASSVLVIPL